MIWYIITIILAVAVFALALVCVLQRADIAELTRLLDRTREMYMEESDRNIEQLQRDILRDDLELLNRWL